MKLLTKIPNRRNALLYRDTLLSALRDNHISYETEIKVHHVEQFSEVLVTVSEDQIRKACSVMNAITKKGPPS